MGSGDAGAGRRDAHSRGGRRRALGPGAVVLVLALPAVACLDEATCPAPLVPVDGRCLPEGCLDCGGETPLCDETLGTCVGCFTDDDCPDEQASWCTGSPRRCLGCLGADDCVDDPDGALCIDGRCAGCRTDGDCERLGIARPVCDPASGACVQCLGDREEQCAGFSCDVLSGVCSGTPLGTVDLCHPCRSDGECADPDARCIPVRFQSDPIGWACLLPAGDAEPPCPRPFLPTDDRPSISGAAAQRYCGPDEAVTTCAGLRVDLSFVCQGSADCGREGADDAICIPSRSCRPRCRSVQGCPQRYVLCSGGACL
jgi:hypothetical protein